VAVSFDSRLQCSAWNDCHQPQRATSLSKHAVSGQQTEIAAGVSLRWSRLCDLKPKTVRGGRQGEHISAIPWFGWSIRYDTVD